jgi:hypothetical protein
MLVSEARSWLCIRQPLAHVGKGFHICVMSRIHHLETFLLIALVLHLDILFLYLVALASFA